MLSWLEFLLQTVRSCKLPPDLGLGAVKLPAQVYSVTGGDDPYHALVEGVPAAVNEDPQAQIPPDIEALLHEKIGVLAAQGDISAGIPIPYQAAEPGVIEVVHPDLRDLLRLIDLLVEHKALRGVIADETQSVGAPQTVGQLGVDIIEVREGHILFFRYPTQNQIVIGSPRGHNVGAPAPERPLQDSGGADDAGVARHLELLCGTLPISHL